MILRWVVNIANELRLLSSLSSIHPMFHVSMLRKCIGDPSQIVPIKDIGISDSLSYKKSTIKILDHQVRGLYTKDVALVKVPMEEPQGGRGHMGR